MPRPALRELLSLEQIESDLFRSGVTDPQASSLYGGLVAAQALRAAASTVPLDRQPHSLHGYFLRPGDPAVPILLQVFRDRDGRSFTARRVTAVQRGTVIFNLSVSFQVAEDGPDVQVPEMPAVTEPEGLADSAHLDRLLSGIEIRLPEQVGPASNWPARGWVRARDPLGADVRLHAYVLTYVSDMFTGLAVLPEAKDIGRFTSLDHAIWFHRPLRLDDWVLLDLYPQSVSGGRGLYAGRVFDRAGVLGASLSQESLFRPVRGAR